MFIQSNVQPYLKGDVAQFSLILDLPLGKDTCFGGTYATYKGPVQSWHNLVEVSTLKINEFEREGLFDN